MELTKKSLCELLYRLTEFTMDLHKEVGELKEESLLNNSSVICFKNDIEDKFNDLNKNYQAKFNDLNEKLEDLEKLKGCMNVLSSHISILEKRNKKFTDNFKFGRFKFKSIDEEEAFNKSIKELNERKQSFVLNED